MFFRARDPAHLRAWYAEHLGIDMEDFGSVFTNDAGSRTVWAPFSDKTDYWPREREWMINFRVLDLDAMLAQLRTAGVEVDERVEEIEFGRFGWAVDCEGNRFELWQPA